MVWEYEFVLFSFDDLDDAEKTLNAEGSQGWEVISLVPKMGKDDSWTIALLKRPKVSS